MHINPPAAWPRVLERTTALAFDMPSEPQTGAMLRMLAATKPGGRLLELGTGTGLATAWLLDGMDPNARLVSIDSTSAVQAVAREVLGQDPRLELVTEDAAIFLQRQAPESFDLIFADAMPGKYEMLDDTLALIRPGGIYIVDDMSPRESWPDEHAARVPLLIADLARRPGFHSVSLSWSSGLLVAARMG